MACPKNDRRSIRHFPSWEGHRARAHSFNGKRGDDSYATVLATGGTETEPVGRVALKICQLETIWASRCHESHRGVGLTRRIQVEKARY
jgi:hypothetical protein